MVILIQMVFMVGLVAWWLGGLVACGGSESSQQEAETDTPAGTVITAVTGVSLSLNDSTIELGSTLSLTASVLPSDASNQAVTWESSDSNVAGVDVKGGLRPILPVALRSL
ncbi:hypothetical protein Ssed_0666 [Shewanella sediminis HAW-EB3]|uniref:BIG2 domain-containing protein n=1 Tax=Shewanella sediminis (strain HAW-EB3) TaxID=425104 RepID=A8FR04_SHESH|nr:hypothetical protein Ssed_0666 [Shewanella sediminis HAW-EB3]